MRAFWSVAAIAVLLSAVTLAQQGGRQGGPPAGMGPYPRMQPLPPPDGPRDFETISQPIRVVPVVRGLAAPWSIAFLPNGDMLVTERVGRLRIVRGGKLDPQSIAGVPPVHAMQQGGLLEVSLHPRFAENRFIYLTYSKAGERGHTTALARGRFDGKALTEVQDIFIADAAQDTTHHAGKILRLRDDGTVPPDNPFVGRAGFRPEIYSYGHRNPQGLAVHPQTGELWETEHGPQGGDELNLVQPGKNYGWPVVTFGREYSGDLITNETYRAGLEPPVTVWVPSIALSGMVFYTGDRLPGWKGDLLLGGLAGTQLHRVVFAPGGPRGRESLLTELRLRIRDVRQGPDGFIYFATDASPDGAILRIEPETRRPTTSAQR
ncbi:MAG: PQQ-dependent sugar dehydrogenase [Acidobacteria bacterium]|nr:PQQ-dependent sugar dehydrogenase [Acidobacteriota bacterium]